MPTLRMSELRGMPSVPVSCHVDYISFFTNTMPIGMENLKQAFTHALPELEPYYESHFCNPLPFTNRAPFNRCFNYGGISILWHTAKSGALIEVSGSGCALLGQETLEFITHAKKLTRIDIAMDMETPLSIEELTAGCKSQSSSKFVSETGVTHYYGSRSSDSFVRIYRYNEPHPRATSARFEIQYKSTQADQVWEMVKSSHISDVILTRAKKINFEPPFELPHSIPMKPSTTIEKGVKSTVRWLLTQVAPAFKNAVLSGIIEDPYQFLEENFIPRGFRN